MRLESCERETIINFNEEEANTSIYTANKAMRRKLERLAKERPEDCQLYRVSRDGQAAEFYIPKTWIKISPPRVASEAQKAAARVASQKAKNMR